MARGNDADNALHELADKFGRGVGNAESMIEGALNARPREFRQAELLPRDEEKTREVKKDLSKLHGPKDTKVIDAAVRGDLTTIVYEDETGRMHLGVLKDDKFLEPEEAPAPSMAAQSTAHTTPNKT